MKIERVVLVVVIGLCSLFSAFGQEAGKMDSLSALIDNTGEDTLKVDYMLELSQMYFNVAPTQAINIAMKAGKLGRETGYLKGVAYALKTIGIAHYYQGDYVESLSAWQKSLAVFDSINDQVGVANILSNIGAIYYNEGDYSNALDYYLRSLKVSEEIGDTLRIVTALINIGAVYNDKPATHDKSLEYSLRALELSELSGEMDAIATSSVNIGEIYLYRKEDEKALQYFEKSLEAMKGTDGTVYTMVSISKVYARRGEFDKALEYLNEALQIADQLNAVPNKVHAMVALAETYLLMGKKDLARKYFKDSEKLALQIKSIIDLQNTYIGLRSIYERSGQFDSAYKYQQLLMNVKDTLYDIESDKLLSNQLFNFQIEKKQNEINLLMKDQELKELDIRKQKIIRNLVIAGFISVIIFLLVVILQKKRISREKERSEQLLLNILPYEIAEELKEKGKSDARDFDQVTVLFTDFQEFTEVAQKMTAKELVEEINYYFKAFDEIITKHKIEKIKTIGDAYMAAGGLPVPNPKSVTSVIKAALEMQQFVRDRQNISDDPYSQLFKMRIGIHTGGVVAGIVGVKKFQYDIWGDTVNTASRMESSGEVGKVNISENTYEQIKDNPEFEFEYRGMVAAKGKGKMKMYFVELKGGQNSSHQPDRKTEPHNKLSINT